MTNPPAKKPPPAIQTEAVATSSSQAVMPILTTVQPVPMTTANTTSVVSPSTTVAITPILAADADPKRLVRELMKKLGSKKKTSEFFTHVAAVCQEEETTSTRTPLEIPPRSYTLQETTTSKALSSHKENPQILPETIATVIDPPSLVTQTETQPITRIPSPTIPHAETAECIHEEEVVERNGNDGDVGDQGSEAEDEGNDGNVVGNNVGKGREIEEKVDDGDVAGDESVDKGNEGDDETAENGEEKECAEGEIPEEVNADEKEEEIVDGDDGDNVETEKAVEMEVDEHVTTNGLKGIVVLEDGPESEDTSADERTIRRNTRRSKILEETRTTTRARCLRLVNSEGEEETGEEVPKAREIPEEAEEVSPEALEKRYAEGRKCKGKQVAKPLKKKQRQASGTLVIQEASQEPIRVPFAKPQEETEEVDEEDKEVEDQQEEEHVYEMMEVLVTKRLLEAVVYFENPKLALICEGRALKGKLAKSGKMYDPPSLQEIESEEEFLTYIRAIGFEWLLDHCTTEVPIALAKEFFASLKFKSTIDPDADSISFRLINEDMVMSIREWSLRMGLFTPEKDEEGIWNEREIGPPKRTAGFDMQTA